MKLFEVARKDLRRSFRSIFNLIMMFGAPFLITGLLYFAFGSAVEGGEIQISTIPVAVANLDQGAGIEAGEMLTEFLGSEDLGDLLELQTFQDEPAARSEVDGGRAAVALIIPPNFSAAALQPGSGAEVILYQDPTLTLGPRIVQDLVRDFIDGFSGAQISSMVLQRQFLERGAHVDQELMAAGSRRYASWLESSSDHHSSTGVGGPLHVRSPSAEDGQNAAGQSLIGPVMAGMMVFFVFFIGANGAQSIVRESEEGTLSRLFTTPTSRASILGGTLIAVFISLALQVGVLIGASAWLFDIRWGDPLAVASTSLGTIVIASGFGVLLMSFVQNTRQAGPVMGGLMTVMGMLGGLFTTGIPSLPEAFDTVNLIVPHGWALRGWKLVLSGAPMAEVIATMGIMVGTGLALFGAGVVVLHRRFA